MASPTSRNELKEYCLRRLGKPVIDIDVEDSQVEDRIDDALRYFYDYHFNGSDKIYYKHIITQENKDDGYITLPENIMGAIRIFDVGSTFGATGGMFSLQYQIALNDLWSFGGMDLVPYWMMQENLQFMEQLLQGHKPIRYNKNKDRLYVDTDWKNFAVGQYLVVEAYEVVDPDTYTDAWSDRWLMQYTTALIKRQWGFNLSKFVGINLVGNIQFNGQAIKEEAEKEIDDLETDLKNNTPLEFMMG